ncbi:MAG: DUF2147 domain-containing protein [Gammaproteobacteria bacterium]|jgi:uncharacterized protein (DUF2147 family)|nr:DUF2147 domain-containing protein [Gammaproteobacteria bacterium]MBT5204467.1 DUF2147 domain-containing protein [Gammaproteobacteria bacterium]MBT5604090.1 DUF2147 domain-containing protein [Gammaproteobacteria bacterium]MBT6246512.1 DUF2147 domain-containing protein [Gammaproteobacteria bacterium]
MRKLSLLLVFFLVAGLRVTASDSWISGYWLTSDSIVHIDNCGEDLCAKIEHIFVAEDVDPDSILDSHNSNIEERSRPLIGINLLQGISRQFDSSNSFKGGTIYNPRDGKSYKAKLQLHDDGNLTVQGCVLFLCDGETWRPLSVTLHPDGSHTAVLKNIEQDTEL